MTIHTSSDLRIASLLPSATAICVELGLEEHLVGITHECRDLVTELATGHLQILTKDGLTVTDQGAIHQAVQDASAASCSMPGTTPSLYPLLPNAYEAANPTVTITQDLCSVCAPTIDDIQKMETGNEVSANLISLQPSTLAQVADSFVAVATTCGIPERGQALKDEWMKDFGRLKTTIINYRESNPTLRSKPMPRLLILEWLDPPFDGGHWTYQMLDYACLQMAQTKDGPKSKALTWDQVQAMNPETVVVGCCGFGLERNLRDAKQHSASLLQLSAVQENQLFCCDGNRYIAQPGPSLLQGAALLAKCGYHDHPDLLRQIDDLGFFQDSTKYPEAKAWARLDLTKSAKQHGDSNTTTTKTNTSKVAVDPSLASVVGDMEDLFDTTSNVGFSRLHDKACRAGKTTYADPETGYSVFTEIAHKNRGWCCGSGCRHCPYSHENVKDKAARIQQPSILYKHDPSIDDVFSLHHPEIKVLFHSGGKDSFLTIRALARQYQQSCGDRRPFGLVLMTTFDAATRNIAHQDIPIDQVLRQAQHLNITLLGIPLRRASGEGYRDRIRRGLTVLESSLPNMHTANNSSSNSKPKVTTLAFGDLHLEHIKEWRDSVLTPLLYRLEYPLWKEPYSNLLKDLETSQVPCFVSGCTAVVDDNDDYELKVGTQFTRVLYDKLIASGKVDGFGERGEFHSIAKVWEVPRSMALSLHL